MQLGAIAIARCKCQVQRTLIKGALSSIDPIFEESRAENGPVNSSDHFYNNYSV